jgi:hypothetical protein
LRDDLVIDTPFERAVRIVNSGENRRGRAASELGEIVEAPIETRPVREVQPTQRPLVVEVER